MAKLSDKQKKEIIAGRLEGTSAARLAKQYGVSETTIRRVLKSDDTMAEKVRQKKEENTRSVLQHMELQKETVCGLLDKLLGAMNDEEKIRATPLPKLATTFGILIDKYTKTEQPNQGALPESNLLALLLEGGTSYDLPEVQSAPAADDEVVDDERNEGA